MDSLGIYSSRRELCPELGKGQHAQQHANMNADEHADAEQEWEGPNHGSRPHPLLLAPGWWPYRTSRHRAANELFP